MRKARRARLPALRRVRRLAAVMDRLRAPGGCPWDREQDHRTLRPYLLEETYEVLEAIDSGDDARLKEELGDLLLQVVFHARLGAERRAFDLDGIADGTVRKLVARHPHVFGRTTVRGTRDVLVNWERIKARENGGRRGPLDGLPAAMPALLRAFRIAEKLDRVGGLIPPDAALRRDLLDAARRFARAPVRRGAGRADLGRVLRAAAFLAARRGVDPEATLREALRPVVRRALGRA